MVEIFVTKKGFSPYGEILTTLFMRFKSRDPVICIFITWSRDYDSNAIDRFYTKNQKYELFLAIRISRNRSGSGISSTCPYPMQFKLVLKAYFESFYDH